MAKSSILDFKPAGSSKVASKKAAYSFDHVIVLGDNGNQIVAAKPNSLIFGGDGRDEIAFTSGRNMAWGGDGRDMLWGGSGNDELHGGKGNDDISGGAGYDVLYGDGGSDTLDVNGKTGKIYGGSGEDYLSTGEGKYQLNGGSGDDFYIMRGTNTTSDTSGNDTYLLSVDNTHVTIKDLSGHDELNLRDLGDKATFLHHWSDDLIITDKESNVKITIKDFFGNENTIETFYVATASIDMAVLQTLKTGEVVHTSDIWYM